MPSPSGFSSVLPISTTGFVRIDALLTSYRWASPTITYSYAEHGSQFSTSSTTGYGLSSSIAEPWVDWFDPLSASDRSYFPLALQKWANVANISFVQTLETSTNVGDIRAAYTYLASNSDKVAWAYFPFPAAKAGDIWFNALSTAGLTVWTLGSYAYFSVLHELGHALGLKHPFLGESDPPNTPVLPSSEDTQSYTIMSYTAKAGVAGSTFSYYPTTPMLFDIAAIQYVYGPNYSYNSGDTNYTYSGFSTYHETIWDGGGNDTITVTGSLSASIDLRSGFASSIGQPVYARSSSGAILNQVYNVWNAYGTLIENAVGGSGADTITGNSANNQFTGSGGNDTIDGGDGFDTANYTGRFSSYTVTAATNGSTVRANAGSDGTDTLSNVERLRFSDGTVALDIGKWETAGEAYRLYQAAFKRAPDLGGLNYWIDQMRVGQTQEQVAHNFIVSNEFKVLYGNDPANGAFITAYYQNVLSRTPDQSGYKYWLDLLDTHKISPEQLLINFSESDENIALVGLTIQHGIWLG